MTVNTDSYLDEERLGAPPGLNPLAGCPNTHGLIIHAFVVHTLMLWLGF